MVTEKVTGEVEPQAIEVLVGDKLKTGSWVLVMEKLQLWYSSPELDLKTTNKVPPETLKSEEFIEKLALERNVALPFEG